MKLRREKKKSLRSQIVKRERVCVLSRELGLPLHWKGKYYLKGSACASQGVAAGVGVSLEELLVQGAAGVRRGQQLQVAMPKSPRNWMQVRHQPRAGSLGSPSVRSWLL